MKRFSVGTILRFLWRLAILTLVLLVVGLPLRRWQQTIPVPEPPIKPLPIPVPNAADKFEELGNRIQGPVVQSFPVGHFPVHDMMAYVAKNKEVLEEFRQTLGKPCVYSDPRYPFDLPLHLECIRLAELVIMEGKIYEAQHQWQKAARCYLDCFELGIPFRNSFVLIDALAHLLIANIARQPIVTLLDRCDPATIFYIFSRLESLIHQILTPQEMVTFLEDNFIRDLALYGQSDSNVRDLSFRAYLYLQKEKYLYLFNQKDLIETRLATYAAWKKTLEKPYANMELPQLRFPLDWAFAFPLYSAAIKNTCHITVQANMVLVKARLRLWAFRHEGCYPAKLAALDVSPDLYNDLYTHSPFIYRVDTERRHFQLYSVGENGIDDGGNKDKDILTVDTPIDSKTK